MLIKVYEWNDRNYEKSGAHCRLEYFIKCIRFKPIIEALISRDGRDGKNVPEMKETQIIE